MHQFIRKQCHACTAVLAGLCLMGFWGWGLLEQWNSRHTVPHIPEEPWVESSTWSHASNETLGFQRIFVISDPARSHQRNSMSLAAGVTGLKMDFVDWTGAGEVLTSWRHKDLNPEQLRSLRGHLDVARKIVEENVSSALVLEDDADWDVRLKSQAQSFAKASQRFLRFNSDLEHMPGATFPHRGLKRDVSASHTADIRDTAQLSPYGGLESWELLWLGHCGAFFPDNQLSRTQYQDFTIPRPIQLDPQQGSHELIERYPPNTRVLSHVRRNTCSTAYALSNSGARRLLYEIGVRKVNAPMDVILQEMCEGDEPALRSCVSVQPALFQKNEPARSFTPQQSEDGQTKWARLSWTKNIAYSVKVNLPTLLGARASYYDGLAEREADERIFGH